MKQLKKKHIIPSTSHTADFKLIKVGQFDRTDGTLCDTLESFFLCNTREPSCSPKNGQGGHNDELSKFN